MNYLEQEKSKIKLNIENYKLRKLEHITVNFDIKYNENNIQPNIEKCEHIDCKSDHIVNYNFNILFPCLIGDISLYTDNYFCSENSILLNDGKISLLDNNIKLSYNFNNKNDMTNKLEKNIENIEKNIEKINKKIDKFNNEINKYYIEQLNCFNNRNNRIDNDINNFLNNE